METLLSLLSGAILHDTVLRLLMGVGTGALIGWEREQQDKPAGLRTHMLVALGATALTIGAIEFCEQSSANNPAVRLDPLRVMAGIVGGVGFLGAGSIVQSRGSVQGITTAAGIWVTAAVGMCCGMGLYQLAITSGVLAWFVLLAVGVLERRMLGTKEDDDGESQIEMPT